MTDWVGIAAPAHPSWSHLGGVLSALAQGCLFDPQARGRLLLKERIGGHVADFFQQVKVTLHWTSNP